MNRKHMKKGQFRPLLLASAVGFVCQSTFAQTAPTISDTPFANRPLHLQSETKTTSSGGIKPNVMLFLDDSGSMIQDADTGSWNWKGKSYLSYIKNCTYNPNNLPIARNLRPDGSQEIDPQKGRCFFSLGIYIQQRNSKRFGNHYSTGYIRPGGMTRMDANINAINTVIDKTGDAVNWHLMTLWGSQFRDPITGVFDGKDAKKVSTNLKAAEIRKLIDNMSPGNGTPATERYLLAANALTKEIKYRCQKNYIVFMSDGDANRQDLPWPNGIYGPKPRFWDNTKSSDSGLPGQGASAFSKPLYDKDLRTRNNGRDAEGGDWDDPKYPKQNIETITIGYGGGLSSNGDSYLKNAAQPASGYYKANNAQELADAFIKALSRVQVQTPAEAQNTTSISTPSVTGSSVASLAALLSLDTGKWSSELKFYKFTSDGSSLEKDASGKLAPPASAEYAGRKILVNNGTQKYWLDSSAAKKEDFAIADDQEFKNGFVPWLMRSSTKSDAQIEAGVANVTNRTVKQYRKRSDIADDPSRQMGDVLDSPVASLGRDASNKQEFVVTAANDGMLYIFQSTGKTDTPYALKLNYLPAGMQRESADDSITVGKAIRGTAEEGYGKDNTNFPHMYLHNGDLFWALTPKTNGLNQQYVLLATMGQGARGAYALTIGGEKRADRAGHSPAGLHAADWMTEVPLWETEKGTGNSLGYTVSTGVLAPVATRWNGTEAMRNSGVHYYAFVANGYKAKNAALAHEVPTLYVYDMLGQELGTDTTKTSGSISNGNAPGTLIKRIPVGGSEKGALSSPTVVDVNFDSVIDIAYAGDQFGNLYRFDFRSAPSSWKVSKIYSGDPTQPITAAPAVYRQAENKYVVVFGTGSDVFEDDRKDTTSQQIIMGIHDDLTKTPVTLAANDARIVQQTLQGDNQVRKITTNNFDVNRHSAWRINLDKGSVNGGKSITSEKVVSKPQMLLSTAYITTRIYEYDEKQTKLPAGATKGNTCFEEKTDIKTGGTSWIMSIDVRSGIAPSIDSGTIFKDAEENTAGLNQNVLSSQNALIDTSNVAPDQDALLPNGDYRSGVVPDMPPPGGNVEVPRNDCLARGSTPSLIGAQADENNPVKQQELDGKRCGDPSFFRANEREIPL